MFADIDILFGRRAWGRGVRHLLWVTGWTWLIISLHGFNITPRATRLTDHFISLTTGSMSVKMCSQV